MRYVREPDVRSVAKGNNTYQIAYTSNSDIVMDGTEIRSAKDV